jgi:hypothetical protein
MDSSASGKRAAIEVAGADPEKHWEPRRLVAVAPLNLIAYHPGMAFFRRSNQEPQDFNDPLLDDAAWIGAGKARYDQLISKHYGSPDTIAAGGDLRIQVDDPASALLFYQKAIDTLHSIYVCGMNDTGPGSWARQPSQRDHAIVQHYLATLQAVHGLRPSAPTDASVMEVTHRLRTISSKFKSYNLDPTFYLSSLETLGHIAPDVDVSGVFWS